MVNKIKIVFSSIVYIAVFLFGVFITLQFKSCSIDKNQKCYNIKDSIVIHDTTVTHIDTIPFVYKPITNKGKNHGFDSTKYITCNTLRVDSISLKDSLIDGKIELGIKNNQLFDYKFVYTPLFPKYIYRTDSIIHEKTVYKTQIQEKPIHKNIIYLSSSIGNREVTLGAAFKNKKDYIIGYRFGINPNNIKSHSVDIKIPLLKFGK